MKQRYAALIYREVETDSESFSYYGVVPALPGCLTAGDSYAEVLERLPEAIELYLKDLDAIPVDIVDEPPHLAVIEVPVSVQGLEPVTVGG